MITRTRVPNADFVASLKPPPPKYIHVGRKKREAATTVKEKRKAAKKASPAREARAPDIIEAVQGAPVAEGGTEDQARRPAPVRAPTRTNTRRQRAATTKLKSASTIRWGERRARIAKIEEERRMMDGKVRREQANEAIKRLVYNSNAESTQRRYRAAIDGLRAIAEEIDMTDDDELEQAFRVKLGEASMFDTASYSTMKNCRSAILKHATAETGDVAGHWIGAKWVSDAMAGLHRQEFDRAEREMRLPYDTIKINLMIAEALRGGCADIALGFELLFTAGMRPGHLGWDEGVPKLQRRDISTFTGDDQVRIGHLTLRFRKGEKDKYDGKVYLIPAQIGDKILARPTKAEDAALPEWNDQKALAIITKVAIENDWDPRYKYDLHTFRSSMASNLIGRGISMRQVEEQGGWTPGSKTPAESYVVVLRPLQGNEGSVAIKGEARDAPRALPAQKGAPPSKPAIEQAPRPTQQTSGTRSQEEVDTMRRHFLPKLRRRK